LNDLQHKLEIELGHGDKSGSHSKSTKHDRVEGVDMVHWEDTHHEVFICHIEIGNLAIDLLRYTREKALVSEHHTLGQTGGA